MMLSESTVSKLHEMRLSIMAKTFRSQMNDGNLNELSFEERFGLIVDSEWISRKNNRLTRLIRSAGYEIPNACIEDANTMLSAN